MAWRGYIAAAIASVGIVAGGCGRVPLLPAGETPAPFGDGDAGTLDGGPDFGSDTASDLGADARTSDTSARDAAIDLVDLRADAAAAAELRDAALEPQDAPLDASACSVPVAPVLSVIDNDEVLSFVSATGGALEIAALPAEAPLSDTAFHVGSNLALAGAVGLTRVLARDVASDCAPVLFDEIYDVRATYSPAPPDTTTTAVASDDPRIVGWAQGVAAYEPGTGVTDPKWMMPMKALGPVGTDNLEVVVLGNGGRITLTFGSPIVDGAGWDFAVFENGFANDQFLELAFVEVSSDGIGFARFDSAFRGPASPCASCSGKATGIGGLAGTYRFGFGTPFDLAALRSSPLVRSGAIDLSSIRYVRIVDIVGDGTTVDSFGRAIIDPSIGGPTAGFDLDAIAVLNQLE
jgi:hypothetical protein